jgi:hypothetical protein
VVPATAAFEKVTDDTPRFDSLPQSNES